MICAARSGSGPCTSHPSRRCGCRTSIARSTQSGAASTTSNQARGNRKRHELLGAAPPTEPAPEGDTRAPLEARRSWARLIRKVYGVDPLLCARCCGTMKIIAVIEPACADTCLRRSRDRQAADRRPAVIRQIRSAEPSSRAQAEELATKPVLDDLSIPDPVMA